MNICNLWYDKRKSLLKNPHVIPAILLMVHITINNNFEVKDMDTEMDNLSQYETNVSLEDGSKILLRAIHPEDAEACLISFTILAARLNFYVLAIRKKRPVLKALRNFCKVDYTSAFVLAAEVVHDGKEMVAIARYYKLPGKNSAELFILVDEAYQARGLGIVLLENLV